MNAMIYLQRLVLCSAIAFVFAGCDSKSKVTQPTEPIIVTSLPIPHMELGKTYLVSTVYPAGASLDSIRIRSMERFATIRVNGTGDHPTFGYVNEKSEVIGFFLGIAAAQKAADEARAAWQRD